MARFITVLINNHPHENFRKIMYKVVSGLDVEFFTHKRICKDTGWTYFNAPPTAKGEAFRSTYYPYSELADVAHPTLIQELIKQEGLYTQDYTVAYMGMFADDKNYEHTMHFIVLPIVPSKELSELIPIQ